MRRRTRSHWASARRDARAPHNRTSRWAGAERASTALGLARRRILCSARGGRNNPYLTSGGDSREPRLRPTGGGWQCRTNRTSGGKRPPTKHGEPLGPPVQTAQGTAAKPCGTCSIMTVAREFMNPAASTVYTWAGVPTCRKRARVPIGRCVAYVYSSTRVVRAVVYGYYACTVAHVSSMRFSVSITRVQ